MKARTSVGLGLALIGAAVGASLYFSVARGQTISEPTPLTPYDWQCQDKNGAKLGDYSSYIEALIACWNDRAGDRIQGGSYQLPARTFPNRPPTITGTPAAAVEAGSAYAFTPSAGDPDGNTLGFTIENRPAWASFDPASGALSGTPAVANVGIYSSIKITASDGTDIASTPAFSITVTPPPAQGLVAPAWVNTSVVKNATDPTRYNIALTWTQVAGATKYELRRCTGQGCTGYTLLASSVTGTQYTNTNLPAGFSYSYKVRAMQGTTAGPMSGVVTITTDAATPPTDPPPAKSGSATLRWVAPTLNSDNTPLTDLLGYRIDYGTSATALTQSVTLTNPALTSYVIDNLPAPGTYFFGLTALAGNAGCLPHGTDCVVKESPRSNVASKTLP